MRRAKERGSALLVALGVLVLLSMMGVTFVILARMEMQAALNFDNIMRARFIAEAGVERAIDKLLEGYYGPFLTEQVPGELYESSPYDSLGEPWAEADIRLRKLPSPGFVFEELPASAPYAWSGPVQGRIGDGYFDLRRLHSAPTVDTGLSYDGGVIQRGVVDLNGFINVNTANELLLANMFVILRDYVWEASLGDPRYFSDAQAATWAQDIVLNRGAIGIMMIDESCYPGTGVAGYRPYRYTGELIDRADVPAWILYGEDANSNGFLDPTENDNAENWNPPANVNAADDGDNVMDPGLRDFITVHPVPRTGVPIENQRGLVRDFDHDTGNRRWYAPVNLNTAPAPVLAAVLMNCGAGEPGLAVSAGDAYRMAVVLVDYRNGPDEPFTSYDIGGDGNDNPFDGWDAVRDPANMTNAGWDNVSITVVAGGYAVLDPYVMNFEGDGVDNDGDGRIDNTGIPPEDPDERYIFPGGLDGFAELEAVLDSDPSAPHPVVGASREQLDYIKANATTRRDIDFDADGSLDAWEERCWTTPFRYDSEWCQIISEGVAEKGGEVQARAFVTTVLRYR